MNPATAPAEAERHVLVPVSAVAETAQMYARMSLFFERLAVSRVINGMNGARTEWGGFCFELSDRFEKMSTILTKEYLR